MIASSFKAKLGWLMLGDGRRAISANAWKLVEHPLYFYRGVALIETMVLGGGDGGKLRERRVARWVALELSDMLRTEVGQLRGIGVRFAFQAFATRTSALPRFDPVRVPMNAVTILSKPCVSV